MLGEIAAVDAHRAAAGRQHAGDHRQRGRLAGAVDAEQAEHLAAVQAQAQILHDLAAGEAPADVVEDEQLGFRVEHHHIVTGRVAKSQPCW
uniref:Uncharacterized protein n=1 Tax=Mizugakiibacter sediminis TaxID=1475481 RepID=A0A0U1PA06_9GAMM